MVERWLYCEGKTDSPVLKAVFNALAVDIIAESTGTNPGKVASWRREQGIIAAAISDRDYCPDSKCTECNVAGSVKLIWGRHSIENYLLDPDVLVIALQQLKTSLMQIPHPPECANRLPTDPETVRRDLIDAGKRLIPQESGYLTIARLKSTHSDPVGRVQLRNPIGISGDAPRSRIDCKEAVIKEIGRVLDAASRTQMLDGFSSARVSELYDQIDSEISAAAFLNDLKFLEVFHGKRLLRSFKEILKSKYGFSPKRGTLQKELILAIETLVLQSGDCRVAEEPNRHLWRCPTFKN